MVAPLRRVRFRSIQCILVVLLLATAAIAGDEEFPPELVSFVPHTQNPVFTARGAGYWDVKIRERGWILRENGSYRMWFTGYDGTREGQKLLGYATSSDGLKWQRHADPIYRDHWVEDMMIVKQGAKYYMFAEGRDDQAHLLTSADGLTWQRRGPIDIRTRSGKPIEPGPYGTPTAWFENGVWHLFYERRDLGVWLATSRDLDVWTHVRDEPVLIPGPETYDQHLIALNQIVKYRGRYYAYYHGSGPGDPRVWTTNIASSPDLIQWKKYSGNPLRPAAENKSSGILILHNGAFRLYTMHDQVHLHVAAEK